MNEFTIGSGDEVLSLHGEHGEGRAFTWDFEGKV